MVRAGENRRLKLRDPPAMQRLMHTADFTRAMHREKVGKGKRENARRIGEKARKEDRALAVLQVNSES